MYLGNVMKFKVCILFFIVINVTYVCDTYSGPAPTCPITDSNKATLCTGDEYLCSSNQPTQLKNDTDWEVKSAVSTSCPGPSPAATCCLKKCLPTDSHVQKNTTSGDCECISGYYSSTPTGATSCSKCGDAPTAGFTQSNAGSTDPKHCYKDCSVKNIPETGTPIRGTWTATSPARDYYNVLNSCAYVHGGISCNNGYTQKSSKGNDINDCINRENNVCTATGGTANTGFKKYVNNGGWNWDPICYATDCITTHHLNTTTNLCESNRKTCVGDLVTPNATKGEATWSNNTWNYSGCVREVASANDPGNHGFSGKTCAYNDLGQEQPCVTEMTACYAGWCCKSSPCTTCTATEPGYYSPAAKRNATAFNPDSLKCIGCPGGTTNDGTDDDPTDGCAIHNNLGEPDPTIAQYCMTSENQCNISGDTKFCDSYGCFNFGSMPRKVSFP